MVESRTHAGIVCCRVYATSPRSIEIASFIESEDGENCARNVSCFLRHQYTRFAVGSRGPKTMRPVVFRDVPESCARLGTVDVTIVELSSREFFGNASDLRRQL